MTKNSFSIMGVVNVTPDSFSDGGRYEDPERAMAQARTLVEHGATYLDFGAESSRPGATPVDADEEWSRLAPVLNEALKLPCKVSVDTYKPEIMLQAAALGVDMINCIKGPVDPETLTKLAAYGDLSYCAMHMSGEPGSMQVQPLDGRAAVSTVDEFFRRAHDQLRSAGFSDERIWLDPGIGFGKTDRANAQLLKQTNVWAGRYQLLIGVSRKSFIGRILDIEEPELRDKPSKMLEFGLYCAGANMIRTHDVKTLYKMKSLLGD